MVATISPGRDGAAPMVDAGGAISTKSRTLVENRDFFLWTTIAKRKRRIVFPAV